MKGMSTVIATILMLMITIGLAGTAYLYASGIFTRQGEGLEIIDGFCSNGVNATITFRNVGTNTITFQNGICATPPTYTQNCGSITITNTTIVANLTITGSSGTISPGTLGTIVTGNSTNYGCTSQGIPRTCVYRIIPPSGRSVVATVNCPG